VKFLKTKISQGSEETCFRCGGIFSHLIANLLLNVSVKILKKSVNNHRLIYFFFVVYCIFKIVSCYHIMANKDDE